MKPIPTSPLQALGPLQPDKHRAVILGAARSGLAAAQFLQARGFQVSLSDAGPLSDDTQNSLHKLGLPFEAGGHQPKTLQQADFLIASPGIPLHALPYQLAAAHQIPVVSEIELACQFNTIPVIAVTGSNGKSTTVSLLQALLEAAGYRSASCGNIGTPMISLMDQPLDYLVLEISSFQLESTWSLQPQIALLLNLYENHLDRHKDMAHYFALKSRLFQCQSSQEHAVLNRHNRWCQQLATQLRSQVHWFGAETESSGLIYQGQVLLTRQELALPGQHNLENVLASLQVAELLELPAAVVKSVLTGFGGIPHRLEKLQSWQGRWYVNDSKSTNYLAAQKALESFEQPIVLIAGGQDKGGDFAPLAAAIAQRVRHVVLMGASAQTFQQCLKQNGYNRSSVVENMQAAVKCATGLSEPGDVILLSPATASYDAYQNFEERGDDFRRYVAALVSQNPL